MRGLNFLAVAQIHVYAAGQARVKAADRAHDVDALEMLNIVFLEDRRILHRVLVWPRSTLVVAWAGVPASRRIGMIVHDFAAANDHVMREHAADGFVETAADGFLRHAKFRRCFETAGMYLRQGFFDKVQSKRGSVSLEV